jgi:hypothetical protein
MKVLDVNPQVGFACVGNSVGRTGEILVRWYSVKVEIDG